jgi:hypothetical protein
MEPVMRQPTTALSLVERPALSSFASARLLELDSLVQRSGSPTKYVVVGRSASGRWIVKDNCGRLGAIFRSATFAWRFAKREAHHLRCPVVIDGNMVELDCLAEA